MKELVCHAFCASLDVRPVPAGYAVRTPYENSDGDPLLVYFVRQGSQWRVEDDGTQVPLLEAHGVDIGSRSRGAAFAALLSEYAVEFDPDRRTLSSVPLPEADLGEAAIRFVALLLRLQDLALLSPQTVKNTFREDALAALHGAFDKVAAVTEHEPLSPDLAGHEADVIIQAAVPNKWTASPPMAIYFGTSEERALQAIIAKMEAEKYRGIDGKVVLMVERSKSNPVREPTYSLAMARLDAVVAFREAREDTMQRLARLAGLPDSTGRLQ